MPSIYEIHILADAYSVWVIYRKTIKTDHHDFDSNWNRFLTKFIMLIITIFDIGSIHSLVNLRRYSAITFFT